MKIKYGWSIVCLLLLTTGSKAQTPEPPKEEFKLWAPVTSLSIERGKRDSVNISVLRSRSFRTGKASLVATPPSAAAGLEITIEPLPEQPDNYTMRLSAGSEMRPGEYSILPTCTLRNKTKAIVVKLTIR